MTNHDGRTNPINRWLVVILLISVVVVGIYLKPIRPEVSLAGESLLGEKPFIHAPIIGEIPLTNTLLTTIIVDLIVLGIAVAAGRGCKADGSPTEGLTSVVEMIIEAIYNLVEKTVGAKWVKQVLPLVATIILLVLTANLLKLFPGMESIGLIEHLEKGHEGGHGIYAILPGLYGITEAERVPHEYKLVPFFRSPSTDLNFTASLALIAVIMVQVFGLRANGASYLGKFLNFGRFLNMWVKRELNAFDVVNPFIDIFVGVLELISEFAKIISFSFRLLGSMFGGAVLVIVLGTLLPVSQFGLYFLELFFGVIQALVFGVLTMVFIAVATKGHGQHEEEQHA